MHKLVVADIDGTLTDDNGDLSPNNRDYINNLQTAGYMFGIASGRYVRDIIRCLINWDLKKPPELIIALNGAVYFDNVAHESYTMGFLKKAWVKEILEMMDCFHLNPYVVEDMTLLCHHEDDYVLKSCARNHRKLKIAKSYDDYCRFEQAKLLYEIKEKDYPDIKAYLDQFELKGYKYVLTQATMLEFVEESVDKGVALKAFCQKRGIELADVIAFGDGQNDIDLISAAGLGVAMQNGDEGLKKVAKLVSEFDNNNDGFAKTLSQILKL